MDQFLEEADFQVGLFEMRSYSTTQGSKLRVILLPQPPKCYNVSTGIHHPVLLGPGLLADPVSPGLSKSHCVADLQIVLFGI